MGRDFDLKCKQEWDHPVPVHMEGNMHQVLEESCERSEDILRKCLHWAREIPYMSNYMMWRLLHIAHCGLIPQGREVFKRRLGRVIRRYI